jgi:hypothetical protein
MDKTNHGGIQVVKGCKSYVYLLISSNIFGYLQSMASKRDLGVYGQVL